MSLDNFLRDLWPKQILIQTGKHTLKYQTAKVLTTRPPEKRNFSNGKKKYIYENQNTCSKLIVEYPLTL